MASITLRDMADRWAVGATIGAYPASNWTSSQIPPEGAPVGSSTATATVQSDGSVTFTGLADGTAYYGVQTSGDTRNYANFATPASGSSGGAATGDVDVATLPAGESGTDALYTQPATASASTTSSGVNVTTSSAQVLASNASARGRTFINDSDTTIYLKAGTTAELNKGIRLNANGGSWDGLIGGVLYTGRVDGIHGGSGNKVLLITEV